MVLPELRRARGDVLYCGVLHVIGGSSLKSFVSLSKEFVLNCVSAIRGIGIKVDLLLRKVLDSCCVRSGISSSSVSELLFLSSSSASSSWLSFWLKSKCRVWHFPLVFGGLILQATNSKSLSTVLSELAITVLRSTCLVPRRGKLKFFVDRRGRFHNSRLWSWYLSVLLERPKSGRQDDRFGDSNLRSSVQQGMAHECPLASWGVWWICE